MALRGSNAIAVYRGDDVEALRKAGRLAREVLDAASAALRPGVTGDELDRVVFDATVARGCYPSPLNYHGFPKSVCVSVNEVICHGIPDSRPIEDGDIVNLDVTLYTPEGFHADLNETFAVGACGARGVGGVGV
jgi:methionyl aminopeptidase